MRKAHRNRKEHNIKAQVLYAPGDLRYEETDVPAIKEDEVLVKVEACGICGSDIARTFVTGTYHFPCIPGHEFAGTVVKTGAGTDPAWQDKRIAAFPLIPCLHCASCRKGLFEMCASYDFLGSRSDGAFAEYVRVPARQLLALPDTVKWEEAAMMEPMAVAVHAMRIANPQKENDPVIAVFGAGTIGMLLVMFLLEAGYRQLFVIGNKDFQKEELLRLGIPEAHFCDTRSSNAVSFLAEVTKSNGAAVCFDCVGSEEIIRACIDTAAPAGTVVFVGNPRSDIGLPKDLYWKILRRQLTIRGVWNAAFAVGAHGPDDFVMTDAEKKNLPQDDWTYVLERLKARAVSPSQLITHRFQLASLPQGLAIMRDKTEPYCKIMISVPQ